MKHSNSDTKIKIQFSKYQNFFSEKNWEKQMYMDDRNAERADLAMRIPTNKSQKQIGPRSKISMSLHQKAGVILSNSNRMGIIEKKLDFNSKKSLSKIGYMSVLPPIHKEEKQTDTQLRKLKQQINQVVNKQIILLKEVNKIECALKQIKLTHKMMNDHLNGDIAKEVENKLDRNLIEQYNLDVLKQIKENLKIDLLFLAKKNYNTQQTLSGIKKQFSFVEAKLVQLNQMMNRKITNKKKYQSKQKMTNEDMQMKVQLAESNIKQSSKVSKIHSKLQNIEAYELQQFKEEKNLQQHNKILLQLRVQQALNGMLDTLFNRDQTNWQTQQKSASLILMYSHLKNTLDKMCTTSQVNFSQTIQSKNSFGTFNLNKKVDLVQLYSSSFTTKQNLQHSIEEKEKQLIDLEAKNKKLKRQWVNLMLCQEQNEQKLKIEKKEGQKQYKSQTIIDRVKKAERHQSIIDQIKYWSKKFEQVLDLKLSKKISVSDRLKKVLQKVRSETANIGSKSREK